VEDKVKDDEQDRRQETESRSLEPTEVRNPASDKKMEKFGQTRFRLVSGASHRRLVQPTGAYPRNQPPSVRNTLFALNHAMADPVSGFGFEDEILVRRFSKSCCLVVTMRFVPLLVKAI
jgi:hypothetical protein